MRLFLKSFLCRISILASVFGLSSCTQHGSQKTLLDRETRKPVHYAGKFSSRKIRIPARYQERPEEMRGIWVATVANIDFQSHKNEKSFRQEFQNIVKTLQKNRFNTIVFQVRPQCDAFYPSAFNPWSRYLTGKEGEGIPDFDPLQFMIREAHAHGLQFHAWLNPYRVAAGIRQRKHEYLATLSEHHFARNNPELVLEGDHKNGTYSLILDPGHPQVRSYLRDTVREIVANYDVDAIHFDDYFYLYNGNGNFDDESFKKYNPDHLSRDDWRRSNVNTLIRNIRLTLDSVNQTRPGHPVQFGISPFGIWANRQSNRKGSLTGGCQSYYTLYADTKYWIDNNLIDYVAPQLYWHFAHPVAAYACLADWWSKAVRNSRVRLYIGQGAYRLDSKSWGDEELLNQLRYNCRNPRIRGSIFFSYRSFFGKEPAASRKLKKTLFRKYWQHPAKAPL